MDSQFQSLKEELQDMCNKNYELRDDHASKNDMNDDTSMCERLEANYIRFEDYQNQDSYNSFSRQSHHDPNDSEKSLTELNNDVKMISKNSKYPTDPPPPQAHTEHVNAIFTGSGK
ncbi:hypothetical protein Tco_0426250 [Tanacetum coccineum]